VKFGDSHHGKAPYRERNFGFITGDFQCAWDALAETPESVAGNLGNFIFALQQKIEPKYFTELDDGCQAPRGVTLPPFLGLVLPRSRACLLSCGTYSATARLTSTKTSSYTQGSSSSTSVMLSAVLACLSESEIDGYAFLPRWSWEKVLPI
jgi:hypothetical protein